MIIGVDEPMIADWIQKRELVKTNSGDVIDAKSLAAQIGLIKAIKDYNLKRIISFHSRVKRAENFALDIQDAINIVNKEHKPKGKLWTDFVSGKMSTHKRRLKLDQLKSLTQGDAGILSNARCLSEGVDVPSLDGIAFIDPRSSQVDIVQAVGRAIRLSKDKTIGTIILPVFIENSDDAQASIESSNFKPIWGVINALKSHDEKLSFELDQLRTNLGKQVGSSVGNISKISFDLPATVEASFSASLSTFLVERTTTPWNFWYGLLQTYIEENGDALVPAKYITPNGYKLGQWISDQRKHKGKLSSNRIEKLENIKDWEWDALEAQWNQGFSYLKKYIEENGNALIPRRYKYSDGFTLGLWITVQRRNKDELTKGRFFRLNSIKEWVWDVKDSQWEDGFKHLINYIDKYGSGNPPQLFKTTSGFTLGKWVLYQQLQKNELNSERKVKLESVDGWVWDKLEAQWIKALNEIESYIQHNGDSNVPIRYKTKAGFSLGAWVYRQRKQRINNTLEEDKISALDAIEFRW